MFNRLLISVWNIGNHTCITNVTKNLLSDFKSETQWIWTRHSGRVWHLFVELKSLPFYVYGLLLKYLFWKKWVLIDPFIVSSMFRTHWLDPIVDLALWFGQYEAHGPIAKFENKPSKRSLVKIRYQPGLDNGVLR